MKAFSIALAFAASFALAPSAALAHDKHGQPQFGGVVAEAGGLELELVLKAKTATLHVSDHGKPVDVKGGSAKLTLLAGSTKSDVTLTAAAGKFEAAGDFPVAKGTKAVAVVTMPGKPPVTARFTVR